MINLLRPRISSVTPLIQRPFPLVETARFGRRIHKKYIFRPKDKNKKKKRVLKIDPDAPPPLTDAPKDSRVIIGDWYLPQKFQLNQSIDMLKDLLHPSMFDREFLQIKLKVEMDFSAPKKRDTLKMIQRTIHFPHPFKDDLNRRFIVFSNNPEECKEAFNLGALEAGGSDLIRKIRDAVVRYDEFDYAFSASDFSPLMGKVRAIIRDKFPLPNHGNVGPALSPLINNYLSGCTYKAIRPETSNIAVVDFPVGIAGMEASALVENSNFFLKQLLSHKKPGVGPFLIRQICCYAADFQYKYLVDVDFLRETEEEA